MTHDEAGAAISPHPASTSALTVLLTVGLGAGTIMQFLLGAFAPAITRDLRLSPGSFGLAMTILFAVGAAGSLVADRTIRRVGLRRSFVVIAALVAAGLFTLAAATTPVVLGVAIVLGGVAMAGVNPTTNGLIAWLVPPDRRPPVVGVVQSGVQAGTLVAGVAASVAAVLGGWRQAVAAVGVVVVLSAAATPLLVPADPAGPVGTRPRLPAHLVRMTWRFSAYAFLMALGAASVFAYLPLFASDRLGFGQGAAGFLTGVFGGVGVLARVLLTRSRRAIAARLRPLLAGLSLGAATALVLVALAPVAPSSVWVAAVLFGATGVAWPAVLVAGLVDVAGPVHASRLTARVFLWFYIGLLASPATFGALLDRGVSYRTVWIVVAAVLASAAAPAHLLGVSARRRGA